MRSMILSVICLIACTGELYPQTGWVLQNPLPTSNHLNDVELTSDSTGIAVGGVGVIVHTSVSGQSWTNQKDGTASDLLSVSFTDVNKGTAVGSDGTILRTITGGVLSVIEISTHSQGERLLMQNYPNPANEESTIRFTVISAGMVSIELFDAQSKSVVILVHESLQRGSYETIFTASFLANGVYNYRLVNGNITETKQLMVLR